MLASFALPGRLRNRIRAMGSLSCPGHRCPSSAYTPVGRFPEAPAASLEIIGHPKREAGILWAPPWEPPCRRPLTPRPWNHLVPLGEALLCATGAAVCHCGCTAVSERSLSWEEAAGPRAWGGTGRAAGLGGWGCGRCRRASWISQS